LRRFAHRLRRELDAQQVLLFGSRARGTEQAHSDYDLIVVSPAFTAIEPWARGRGLRRLFREEGGSGGMDLICLTPEEFECAKQRISFVAAVLPETIDLLSPTPTTG
jgi:predicted nucleotidyltransferase